MPKNVELNLENQIIIASGCLHMFRAVTKLVVSCNLLLDVLPIREEDGFNQQFLAIVS